MSNPDQAHYIQVRTRTDRCRHEMLPGQCSVCRGMPYKPPVMYDDALRMAESNDPPPDLPEVYASTPNDDQPLRWLPAETQQECTNCGAKIREGQAMAFVPELDGGIGVCCAAEIEALS